jgi:hypothetical protein
MEYVFSPATQALLNTGALKPVISATGNVLPLVRDAQTGRFVEMAVGAVTKSGPIQPLIAPVQAATGFAHMVQTHQGFQAVLGQLGAIQSSLGVLQATTAFIGVGTVAIGVLSAVNLWQTLKLRQDIKKLGIEVREGFLDLKELMHNQHEDVLQRLNEIPQDIEFKSHQIILVQGYGRFLEACQQIENALHIEDQSSRNVTLANIRQTLSEALGDYRNRQLLSELCAAGQLRRFECAWAIEQTIAVTYQLQNEPVALSKCIGNLQSRMRQDILYVLDASVYEDQTDFLFPEIMRIHDHDLAVLAAWQEQVDWMRSLPPEELSLLEDAGLSAINTPQATIETEELPSDLPEQQLYETLKQKSHPLALEDSLRLLLDPKIRNQYETEISQQTAQSGHSALNSTNLKQMSDLAVANLYWYFCPPEEDEEEMAEEAVAV